MEWVFLLMTVAVLWLVEKQYNDLLAGLRGMEDRLNELAGEVEDLKIKNKSESRA